MFCFNVIVVLTLSTGTWPSRKWNNSMYFCLVLPYLKGTLNTSKVGQSSKPESSGKVWSQRYIPDLSAVQLVGWLWRHLYFCLQHKRHTWDVGYHIFFRINVIIYASLKQFRFSALLLELNSSQLRNLFQFQSLYSSMNWFPLLDVLQCHSVVTGQLISQTGQQQMKKYFCMKSWYFYQPWKISPRLSKSSTEIRSQT